MSIILKLTGSAVAIVCLVLSVVGREPILTVAGVLGILVVAIAGLIQSIERRRETRRREPITDIRPIK